MTTPRGFALLYIVIITGALMLGLSLAAATGGSFAGNRLRSYQNGAESRALLMRCGETLLMQIRNTTTLTGSGSITAGTNASCTYTITGSSVPKTVAITATRNGVIKRATITVSQLTPAMTASWIEGQ